MFAWYFTELVANDIAVIPVGAKAIKYRASEEVTTATVKTKTK